MTVKLKKDFLDWLESLNIPLGGHWRGDCWNCGGNNSLSVGWHTVGLAYHCFRASCGIKGRIDKAVRVEDIRSALSDKGDDQKERTFDIPEYWAPIAHRQEGLQYIATNHCLEAYQDKRADIRYDPKQHRVVFLIWHKGECYGATGRALNLTNNPKWYIYGTSGSPFFVGSKQGRNIPHNVSTDGCGGRRYHEISAVVEDCASACAVSSVLDGVAILGTNLLDKHIELLSNYSTVYVALDKDAAVKSIDLQRKLSFFVKQVKVVLLEKDLKYCTTEEIKEIFRL